MNYKKSIEMKSFKSKAVSLFLFLFFFIGINVAGEKSIVDRFGVIKVKGNQIVDKNNMPVALHGMSLFWSQWGGKYYNEECIRWLRDDWKCTVVRAACGVEQGGYLDNAEEEFAKVKTVIDACIELGMYVIVDWHSHHAEDHLAQSEEFFAKIARRYGGKPNIIYEVYNEPLKVSWNDVVKPYADTVIKVIRQYDPDNLIIVGTPLWSQDVDIAAKDPISDSNVAYSYHFYTSEKWHRQGLRDKAIAAAKNGAALFVTEYGISEANGDGNINYGETERWFSFMDSLNLSSCNWSVMDKNETSAALKPGADAEGGWSESDLSESGNFIRKRIRKLNGNVFNEKSNVE